MVDDATLFGTCTGEMFLVTGVIHEKSAVTKTTTGITHQAITFTFHLRHKRRDRREFSDSLGRERNVPRRSRPERGDRSAHHAVRHEGLLSQ